MGVQTLWKERANAFWTMAIKYLRYIGNSGFLFSVYVAIIAGSFYYGKLLKALPDYFPAVEFMTVLLLFFVGRGKIRTFLKEPDANFLLPLEQRFRPYIQRSLLYSLIMQAFNVLVIMLVLGPLYFAQITTDRASYFASLFLILLLTGWNLFARWEELRVPDGPKRTLLPITRYIMVLVTLYAILSSAWIITAIFVIGLAVLYLLQFRPLAAKHTLKWNRLISLENDALMLFYRIANMFVEVPQLNRKVKNRAWATPFITFLTKPSSNIYAYMYARAFIRSNDYFGIFLRLTVIGILLMVVLPSGMILWTANVLILYMTAIQLTTLWPHFDLKVWVDLYPVPRHIRFGTFQGLITRIMFIQVLLFSIASFARYGSVIESGIILVSGLFLVIAFVKIVLYKQLSKRFEIIEAKSS
ncbi:ABC transporter permease [Pseudalkalibacillus berkeleyi]|uniref:ABC transporter permease n=1 Tax=Pseudalkalibacillus berkeleyi TaxID=1069813 RepID=A0ABS9GWJ5_9BACL|nr:ABC transporter permease [Pseudalkalibacillus berkeleyi]MCF6136186.1 ABC transporter permease [Pseudalkalibacillus berkeleyi]